MKTVYDSVSDLHNLFDILAEDVTRADAAVRASDDPYSRRAFVRVVFAFIDGLIYRMKQIAYATHLEGNDDLTAGERALLLEEAYDLNDKGEVFSRPANLQLLKNVRFAFSTLAKCFKADFVLPVGEAAWEALGKSAGLRNRLMHPKSAADLAVSDDELAGARTAYLWFKGQSSSLFKSILKELEAWMAADKFQPFGRQAG